VTQVVINGEHFLTAKRGEAELIDEKKVDVPLQKIRSGCRHG